MRADYHVARATTGTVAARRTRPAARGLGYQILARRKIFDRPGGASITPFAANLVATKAPKATKVTFIAAFDTYLVVKDKAIHHVVWNATTVYDPATKASAAIVYGTGSAGTVAALPAAFKTVLDTQYSGNKIQ